MTDNSSVPGASALLHQEGGPSPEPMSPSREKAFSRWDEYQRSPALRELLLKNDPSALEEVRSLRQQISAPTSLQVMVKPDSTAEARELVADTWARFADLPDDVIKQFKERPPVTEQEYKRAQFLKNQLHSDKAWVARLFNGDIQARRQSAMISLILSSNIKT